MLSNDLSIGRVKILICALIFSININAQNYLKYYNQINKAEQFICKSNYRKSIRCYENALECVDVPFVKDVQNLRKCCILIDDTNKVIKYTKDLIKIGYTIDCFHDTILTDTINNNIFQGLKPETPNLLFFNEIKDRFYKEQELDQKRIFNNDDFEAYGKCVIDNMEYIRTILTNADYSKGLLSAIEDCRNASYVFFTLLHYYQLMSVQSLANNPKYDFLKFLSDYDLDYEGTSSWMKKAVIEGKIAPNVYAQCEDSFLSGTYGSLTFVQVNDTCGFVKYSRKGKMNKKRKAIGLCTLSASNKIVKYVLNMIGETCPYPKTEYGNTTVRNQMNDYFDLRNGIYQVRYIIIMIKKKVGKFFLN